MNTLISSSIIDASYLITLFLCYDNLRLSKHTLNLTSSRIIIDIHRYLLSTLSFEDLL